MMTTKRKSIAAVLAVMLAAGAGGVSTQSRAGAKPQEKAEPLANVRASADVKDSLSDATFPKLHALIRPRPGGFDDIPWLTSLWQARKKAAAEGKPILLWVGDGHPLGWT
ncbi:MAG TPA: hypothetical protein VKD72_05740 [Gemmataceae bacterium]|nr:hypothetical protein [Gemmataceae bacterium]